MKSPPPPKLRWPSAATIAVVFFISIQQCEGRVALTTNHNSLLPDAKNFNAPLTAKEAETVDLMAQMIASHLRNKMDSEIERLGLELYGAIKTDQEKADEAVKGGNNSKARWKPKSASKGKNGHSHAKPHEKYYKRKFFM